MDKELCFYIQGDRLYLEQVLVDYNDIPIFFVCKDENVRYYLALCTDVEELKYIVINLSDVDLYRLLHGKIPMRDVFTKQKCYWEIISEEQIELDSVTCKSIETIDYSALPDKGAYFEILTDEVSSYVKRFDQIFLSIENFEVPQQELDFIDGIINEGLGFSSGFVEKYLEIYDCQLEQKVIVGLQTKYVDYGEYTNFILKSDIAISDNMCSEEWKASEINILVYAA